jgi:hypothetical protein
MSIEVARDNQGTLTVPNSGRGIYTTTDGREPMQLTCRFGPEVSKTLVKCVRPSQLAEGLHAFGTFIPLFEQVGLPSANLSLMDFKHCLEKIIDAYAHDRTIETPEAVAAIGAIYGRVRAALNELPEHPRLLPRREFIDTQGAVRAVTASLGDRESNEQLEGALAAPNLRIEMEQYQGPSHSRRMSWLSYAQLDFIHTCLSESALQPSGEVPPALFVSLLAEINEKLIDKLAMLHGDGMENIAGTNLFVPRERKAISRAAIEHALLTSTSEQCHETLKVGALMIAIGGGVLTLQELRELGHNIDCNFFVLSHEEQLQTGLRILKLLPGLTEGDRGLQSVLQAYSRDGLTVEGMGPEALNLCKQIYGHRRDLSYNVVEGEATKGYQQCRNWLVQLISNGTHHIDADGIISQTAGGKR